MTNIESSAIAQFLRQNPDFFSHKLAKQSALLIVNAPKTLLLTEFAPGLKLSLIFRLTLYWLSRYIH
jgi:hypothetical protein